MEGRTIGIIFAGQLVGRGVEETTSMIDASVAPIAGQPASRILNVVIGGGAMIAPMVMKTMNPDLQVGMAIAGSHALVDAVADGVKDALGMGMPLGATRLGAAGMAAPSGGRGMTQRQPLGMGPGEAIPMGLVD